jgi:hypothetical protein
MPAGMAPRSKNRREDGNRDGAVAAQAVTELAVVVVAPAFEPVSPVSSRPQVFFPVARRMIG